MADKTAANSDASADSGFSCKSGPAGSSDAFDVEGGAASRATGVGGAGATGADLGAAFGMGTLTCGRDGGGGGAASGGRPGTREAAFAAFAGLLPGWLAGATGSCGCDAFAVGGWNGVGAGRGARLLMGEPIPTPAEVLEKPRCRCLVA